MTPGAMLATTTLAAWSGVYVAISAVAMVRASHRPAPQPRRSPLPSVLLVRPCTGDDASLEPALCSTAAMRRGDVALRVLFTVERRGDAAWPHIRRAAQHLRARGFDAAAIVAPTSAYNRKVGQLEVGTADMSEAVMMCVDADVDLTGFDLEAFVRPLGDGVTGAVWAPPVEVETPRTLGDRASAAVLGASLHAFSLLGALDEAGLVGKTFAVQRDALQACGGFGALSRHLGEDMELARRLRARGWSTRMHRTPVRSIAAGRSWATVLARYARWLWVIRAQRPSLLASYPLLLSAAPLLLSLLVALMLVTPTWGLALFGMVYATRTAVALAASAPRGRRLAAASFEWLLADLVLLSAFVRALGRPQVAWRGRTLRLGRGGRLTAVR